MNMFCLTDGEHWSTTVPGAPGSAERFNRFCPQRADTLQFIRFGGRVPLVRNRQPGRFAVLWTCGFWTSL